MLTVSRVNNYIKHRIGYAAGAAFAFIPQGGRPPGLGQWTMSGDFYATPAEWSPHDRFGLFRGRYETEELKLLEKVQPSQLIIELGANIGFVGRHAISRVVPGGTYVCVEANPKSQEALEYNAQATRKLFPDREIRIVPMAVTDPDGDGKTLSFAMRPNLSSSILTPASADKNNQRLHQKQEIAEVSCISLSRLMETYAAPDDKNITVICDIEGGEKSLLEDREALRRIRHLAIEFHEPSVTGFKESAKDLLDAYIARGFRPVTELKNGACCLLTREAV